MNELDIAVASDIELRNEMLMATHRRVPVIYHMVLVRGVLPMLVGYMFEPHDIRGLTWAAKAQGYAVAFDMYSRLIKCEKEK